MVGVCVLRFICSCGLCKCRAVCRAKSCSTGDLDFSLIMSRNPNLMLLHRARKKREVGK